ncbi:MAG TPA: ABC transporter substrate-binding protein [Longimicrobiales bacterium]|nr:ABC transporter substrate-binding protein [Longimicrobiales bacterium]
MPAMRRRMRHLVTLLAISASAATLAACGDGGNADRDPARYGGTVVVVNNSDIENMNPLAAADRYTQEVNRYFLFLPLIRYTADLDYEPALAERWEMLGDTGVVFHLRRDVHWHDGVRTTARDVVFTYERAVDPETAYPNASYFEHWTGVEAQDSFTVRFTFGPHLEPLAGLTFLPIAPAHALEDVPPAAMRQAAFNKQPVGNGPYRFVSYRANDRTVFEANPDFPAALGGKPYIDRIVYRPIPDPTAQFAELAAGTADIILQPQAEEFVELAARPGIRGLERPGRQYASIMWNGRVEPLDDPAVRRALTHAIDRQQIVQTLRGGYGELAIGPIGPYHWAYDDGTPPVPFSPDSARALLAAAGLRDTTGDGMLDLPDGRPFTIELKMPATQMNRDMAEMIRSHLAAVGVRMTTRPMEFNTLVGDLTSPQRNFQAALMAWESDFRINLRDTFHSDAMSGIYQTAGYANPRVDMLIDSVGRTVQREQATAIYGELQRIMRDEQPWSFLYYYPDLVLVRDRLQGVEMDIRGAFTNVTRWYVEGAGPEQRD